jgi:hypothetical protein
MLSQIRFRRCEETSDSDRCCDAGGPGLLISVVFARCCQGSLGRSWIIETPTSERKRTTLLALLDVGSNTIESLRVFPGIPTRDRHMRVRENDDWVNSGVPLVSVSSFLEAVRSIRQKN